MNDNISVQLINPFQFIGTDKNDWTEAQTEVNGQLLPGQTIFAGYQVKNRKLEVLKPDPTED